MIAAIALCAFVWTANAFPVAFRKRIAPVDGQINASMLFVGFVTVGKQTFALQLDSGSSGTGVPTQDCREDKDNQPCLHPSPGLVPHDCFPCSLAYALGGRCNQGCAIHSLGYADGSRLSGNIVESPISLGPWKADAFQLLAANTRSKFNSEFYDGIMGLSYPALDPLAGSDALTALGSDEFAFCGNTDGGFFTLDEDSLNEYGMGEPKWIPLNRKWDYYAVTLSQISWDSLPNKLTPATERTIVDTGTTFLLLPEDYYMTMRSMAALSYPHLPGFSGKDNLFGPYYNGQRCFDVALFTVPLSQYPNITLVFENGVHLNISASMYLLNVEGRCYELGIGVCQGCGVVLGDTFLRGYNSIFSRKHSRVGFAPVSSKCHEDFGADYTVHLEDSNRTRLVRGDWERVTAMVDPPKAGILTDWTASEGIISPTVATDEMGRAENWILLNATTASRSVTVTVSTGGKEASPSVAHFKIRDGDVKKKNDVQWQVVAPVILSSAVGLVVFFFITYWFQVRSHARQLRRGAMRH